MTNKPKQIGTKAETAVVKYLRSRGYPAERIALHGTADEGDIHVTDNLILEVKAGHAAEAASDNQIAAWLAEARTEAAYRGVEHWALVTKRKGKGDKNVAAWWCHMNGAMFTALTLDRYPNDLPDVRMTFTGAVDLFDIAKLYGLI